MEPQAILNAVLSVASLIGGWALKVFYDSISELRHADGDLHERVTRITETLPGTYMRRDDFSAFAGRVEGALARIESKLDGKADK